MVKDSVSSMEKKLYNDSIGSLSFSFPYSLVEKGSADSIQSTSSVYVEEVKEEVVRYDGKPMPFNLEKTDGIFVLLLFCFLFFAHIYNGGFSFLKESISLLFTPEKNYRDQKQITSKELLYSYFLMFQGVVLISICLYVVFSSTSEVAIGNPLVTILIFIFAIGLFFGIKDFIYRYIGYVFGYQQIMSLWRRLLVVSIEILGMLYFIPTLLLVYFNEYHFAILVFMLILFLIVQITLFYQIIVFFINQKFNFLYLIAYLCTIEILPYIFLIIGLGYLYRIDVFNTLWL